VKETHSPDAAADSAPPDAARNRWRHAWLALGIALQLVANGRWILPEAAWLAPIGWLVYLERSRSIRGVATALPLYVLVEFVRWRGLVPAPGSLYYLIVGTYGLVYFLPFVVHRLVAPRLPAVPATLVFPAAWVSFEFVFQRWVTPYGSWFSLAYTQTDSLALLQLVSVTGAAGVSFLLTWFASTVAWVLRPGHTWPARVRAAGVYAGCLAAVLVFGQVRLARAVPGTPVRVAGLVPSQGLTAELEAALRPVRAGDSITPVELQAITTVAERLNDDLFTRTRREARSGARLVVWSETAGRVLKRDEQALVERAQRLAGEEGVDLMLAYGVWNPESRPPFENKVAAVSATGELAWMYEKAHPIAGAESPIMARGDGVVRALATSYGSIGAVICHDLDFPRLLRQAPREAIGLVVGPSADWSDITPLHADMATLRAIEDGFSLFRPTSNGRSLATDSRGRTLGRIDYADDAMIAYVPVAPVVTLYGVAGDVFAWLAITGLALLTLLAYRPVFTTGSSMKEASSGV
jgi:apolipoprotein N-acyltransferase